jgi:uncharacterized phiE125 gp8 family phage protein
VKTLLTVVEEPKELPVKVLEAREHLKETSTARDAEILRLIYAATEWAAGFQGRTYITTTYDFAMPSFPYYPYEIDLPRVPVAAVVSVKYRDGANVEQTLATSEYQVLKDEWRARIALASGKAWPATYERGDAVTVRFTAGYGGAGKVPFQVQAAILLFVEAYYDRDERMFDKLLEAAQSLLYPLRVVRI